MQRALQDAQGDIRQSRFALRYRRPIRTGARNNKALRTALENETMIQDVKDEHPLGAVLVATVFEGFYSAGLFIAKSYYH